MNFYKRIFGCQNIFMISNLHLYVNEMKKVKSFHDYKDFYTMKYIQV